MDSKSVALGAQGAMIGRAHLYGLGAFGEQGVTKVLELMKNELATSLSFTGVTDINDVDQRILIPFTIPML